MPVLRRLLSEVRSFDDPLSSDDSRLAVRWGAVQTVSGRRVTEDEALRTSAVYGCVRLLAESIGMLPVHVIRRDGRHRRVEAEHPVARLIGEEPNPEQDAGEFWRGLMVSVLLGGDAVGLVETDSGGAPTALWPVMSSQFDVFRTRTRQLGYRIFWLEDERPEGMAQQTEVHADRVLHVRAFGTSRLRGLSPIGAARESIGTARSAQDYASRFYANDASPGGVLEVPDELSDEQFERLEKAWLQAHRSVDRAHSMAILESGAKWQQVGISPQDAEFIHTRKFEVAEIARIFGVPPHMIGDTEKSTSWGTGIEQQTLGFLAHSLMPWIVRAERVATRMLLRQGPYADRQLSVRFSPEIMLRADLKSRYEAYAIGRQWGWESTNSILQLEDRDPIDGGDIYLQPENMRPTLGDDDLDVRDLRQRIEAAAELWRAGYDAQQAADLVGVDVQHLGHTPSTVQWEPPEARQVEVREWDADVQAEQHAVYTTAFRQYLQRQRDVLAEGQRASASELMDRSRWDDELTGMLRRLGEQTAVTAGRLVAAGWSAERLSRWLAAAARQSAESYNTAIVQQLDVALQQTSPSVPLRQLLDDVYQGLARQSDGWAQTQITTVGNAAQIEAAGTVGRRTKTWLTSSGDPRDEHVSLDGETVGLGETFSNGGRYPGDPALPAGERINCQCRLAFGSE